MKLPCKTLHRPTFRLLGTVAVVLALAAGCDETGPSSDASVSRDSSDAVGDLGPDLADVSGFDDGDAASDLETDSVGEQDDVLRLEHLQVLGTHNSYHRRSDPVIHESHDYTHLPLDAQLDLGVRAFEIDIHNPEDLVAADDFAVYHITFLDAETTCLSLRACLSTVVAWSDANPTHVPVILWIEPKGDAGGGEITDLPRLDSVIADVVPANKLITPTSVRGTFPTLRAALSERGWPTLGEARGKLLFALLDTEEARDTYTEGMTVIGERTVFVGAKPSEFDQPWAAVAKINNPGSDAVSMAHAAGILAASNLCLSGESAQECYEDIMAAEANGSHHLKTDYPTADGNPYTLQFAPSCNPVTAPAQCRYGVVE